MQSRPFIRSLWSFLGICCFYIALLIQRIYGLIHYRTQYGLAWPIFIGYCTCVISGIICIWVTPSWKERTICGLTSISFFLTLISQYVIGLERNVLTWMSVAFWTMATILVLTLLGHARRELNASNDCPK